MRNIVLFVTVAVLFTAMGCATCPPPDVLEVPVPVAVQAPALPLPDTPDWESPGADPSDVRGYIRALIHDLVSAWSWGTEMRHVIESHNEALADGQP